MRTVTLTPEASRSIAELLDEEPGMKARLDAVIEAAAASPHSGLGNPRQLAGRLSEFWSRRISERHRLVYAVRDDSITILLAKNYSS